MIKIITGKAFSGSLEVDNNGKIINATKIFSKFINQPLTLLEQAIKKYKFQSLKIEDVEEV